MKFLREAAIERSIRDYCARAGIDGAQQSAAIAHAIKVFRDGGSAASGIWAGRTKANELKEKSNER